MFVARDSDRVGPAAVTEKSMNFKRNFFKLMPNILIIGDENIIVVASCLY